MNTSFFIHLHFSFKVIITTVSIQQTSCRVDVGLQELSWGLGCAAFSALPSWLRFHIAVQPTIPLQGNIGSVVSFALSLGPHNDTNIVHNTDTVIMFCYYVSLDITMDIFPFKTQHGFVYIV